MNSETISRVISMIGECEFVIINQDSGERVEKEHLVGIIMQRFQSCEKTPFQKIKEIEKKEKITYPFMPKNIDYDIEGMCKGIKKSNNLFVPCGVKVKTGMFCKVCAKKEDSDASFKARCESNLGEFDKTEVGLATCLAKGKVKETKDKDEIETYVHAEVGRRLGFVGLCAEDVDSYHTTIDWTRINLSGKRGRPKKAPKPIITNVPHIMDGKDIIASLVEQAEYISEDEEEDKTIEEKEEEIEVIKIKYIDDKVYYLDEAKNEVYDEGQLPIGQWNPDTKRIIFED